MRFVSCHIMPLVINSLGGRHPDAHTHTHTYMHMHTLSISRNEVCTDPGLKRWPSDKPMIFVTIFIWKLLMLWFKKQSSCFVS